MKSITQYIKAAQQEKDGFSKNDLETLVNAVPSVPTLPVSSKPLFSTTTMITSTSLAVLSTSIGLWFGFSPVALHEALTGQESTPQAAVQNMSHSAETNHQEFTQPTNSGTRAVSPAPTSIKGSAVTSNTTIRETQQPPAIAAAYGTSTVRKSFKSPLREPEETYVSEEQRAPLAQFNTHQILSAFSIPKNLAFCGESIPLEDMEVRERVDREFMSTLQQPGRVMMYLKRAKRWFPLIERILKEEQMHDDIKYLCVAESELTQARSPMGAVGFWQFIESTAKDYGLQVNDYVDERKNIEKATRAACRYFRKAKLKLPSWTLCAAGYNQGITGTERDVVFQETSNYFDLYLNEETSRYVIRIAAIKHIMENAERYGFTVNNDVMYQPYTTESFTIPHAVPNLQLWAKEHNCNYKYLKLLNPWLKKNELPNPPDGSSWNVLLPKQRSERQE